MNIKKMIAAGAAMGLLTIAPLAGAASVVVNVDAMQNSAVGGFAAHSHVYLDAGEAFQIRVDPNQTWNLSGGDPAYTFNANGGAPWTLSFWSADGTRFDSVGGSLFAQVGNGHFFTVGTQYYGHADTSGEVKFFFTDSDAFNNSGSVDAVFVFPAVSPVPEPSQAAMMGLGLAGVGLVARARRRRG